MTIERRGALAGQGRTIGIVAARFNQEVTARLLQGARAAFLSHGVAEEDIHIHWVPGSFEIPTLAARLARGGRYDAVLCLGAIIRGETLHFDYIAHAVARGLARIGAETGVPTLLGVLTTDTVEQAMERSGGQEGNRGADAALGALEMVDLLRQLP